MKHWLRHKRGFLVFLALFGVLRTAVADWNPIPSGSMRPTLLEGDVVLVDRLAYDLKVPLTDVSLTRLGEPQRGDVVTFTSPTDGVRLIKRLVAVPGDTVELRRDTLFVNGAEAVYGQRRRVAETVGGRPVEGIAMEERQPGAHEHAMQVMPSVPARREFGPVNVPADHFFFLGDNRDDSADSRYIGFVPRSLLIGRAHHVLVSADILGHWAPRFDRLLTAIQ